MLQADEVEALQRVAAELDEDPDYLAGLAAARRVAQLNATLPQRIREHERDARWRDALDGYEHVLRAHADKANSKRSSSSSSSSCCEETAKPSARRARSHLIALDGAARADCERDDIFDTGEDLDDDDDDTGDSVEDVEIREGGDESAEGVLVRTMPVAAAARGVLRCLLELGHCESVLLHARPAAFLSL